MIRTIIQGRHCEIFDREEDNSRGERDLLIDFFPEEMRIIPNGLFELKKLEAETHIEAHHLAEDFVKTNFHLASIVEP